MVRNLEQQMSMEEFISLPNTIDLIFKYSNTLHEFLETLPYLRIGNTIGGLFIIVYIQVQDLQKFQYEAHFHFLNVIPLIYGLLGRSELEAAGIMEVQQQPYLDLKGRDVLIGFIDTGIDYTKEAFIYEDGTSKVKSIWDQTIPGNAPEGYYFGTEYTDAQINEALQTQNPFDIVPSRDTVGHGTFLASVAASRLNNEHIGAAPDADLIVVKLKKANPFYIDFFCIPSDQKNAYETSDVMLGILYVLEAASRLKRPVSICIGLGTNLGSHGGYSRLSSYLSLLSNYMGVAAVTAAGNESNMRHHTHGFIENTGESQDIEISIGDNSGSLYMELWNSPTDQFSVSVTSPLGETTGRLPFRTNALYDVPLILETSRIMIIYNYPAEGSGKQQTVVRITDPTPGIWRITVYGDIVLSGEFHTWLPLTGLGDPETEFLSPYPNHTITTPSTADHVISSGAYDSGDNILYVSSSWGPNTNGFIRPTLASPGVNVSGLFPTGFGTMTGTSVSAAITAGACALMLQWGIVDQNDPSMNSSLIGSYLIKGCDRDPNVEYPNNQWGYGKLNLMNTFNEMRK